MGNFVKGVKKIFSSAVGGSVLSGLTTGYLTKATSASTIGDSVVYEDSGNIGIGLTTLSAKVHIKGADATSSNYGLKIDNSASVPIFYVRNDKAIIYGSASEATRNVFENGLNRLVFGTNSEHDTANLYIKQNNTSLPSHYINVVNTSNLNYFSIKNDGKTAIGLQQNYAIPYDTILQVLGGNTSSDRLLSVKNNITNSDLFAVLGNGYILANNLPTSSAGLPTGTIWNNGGVLNIV